MRTDSGKTRSLWMELEMPSFTPLTGSLQCEVCVVGAGIAGLTTAYLLAQAGCDVVVLDDGPLAGGETCRTTAHLASIIDDRFTEMERLHGERLARLAHTSHAAAIDRIESIAQQEGIDCDFRRVDGYLFLAPGRPMSELEEELAAAQRCGVVAELLPRAPLPFQTGHAIRFPNQGQFHPLKYLAGLARAIVRDGGRIFTGSRVEDFSSGTPAKAHVAGGHTVTAKNLVIATNSPVNDRVVLHTKMAPYRTYAISARVPARSIPYGLYWDTEDPYHYVRLQPNPEDPRFEQLIVGGEDHKTGQYERRPPAERFAALEHWTRQRFPMVESVRYRWSGQVMETDDGLAFIGRNPADSGNVFVATGDSGMGMTHGTIAGILLTDLIFSRQNPWTEVYAPNRKLRSSLTEWVKENVNVARQYTDWVTGGEVRSTAEIAPGEGAVLRSGASKLACYRDEQGRLHQHSAVCTHMGCLVHFNAAERSWDCPCHGSRFDPVDGHVLNGPALNGLRQIAAAGEGEEEGEKAA